MEGAEGMEDKERQEFTGDDLDELVKAVNKWLAQRPSWAVTQETMSSHKQKYIIAFSAVNKQDGAVRSFASSEHFDLKASGTIGIMYKQDKPYFVGVLDATTKG